MIFQENIFLGLHTFVEVAVGAMMYAGKMPPPYDVVFQVTHPVVRGFAGGGAASTGVIGALTLTNYIPKCVGMAFCGGYQLFIAFNEIMNEASLFGGLTDAREHILLGVTPHLALGVWGIIFAARRHREDKRNEKKK